MAVASAPSPVRDGVGKTPAVDAAIDISGVSLRFDTRDGPVQALSNINLKVARGEFVSFIGPSGCGKTTLLRAVADLERPTSGAIRVNGMSPHEARTKRAYGYVFQAPALYPWRTVGAQHRAAARDHGLRQGRSARRGSRRASTSSTSRASATSFPGNCRAACSSAPRSRARCPSIPISS